MHYCFMIVHSLRCCLLLLMQVWLGCCIALAGTLLITLDHGPATGSPEVNPAVLGEE